MMRWFDSVSQVSLLLPFFLVAAASGKPPAESISVSPPQDGQVSYHRDVRPLLQTHCVGCHQPAKASGDYVLTSVAKMVLEGESGSAAIVPGEPGSNVLSLNS